jgi:NAD(P)-dependent dehydrogenase (short-subunit alcohol dehydrogenase family)
LAKFLWCLRSAGHVPAVDVQLEATNAASSLARYATPAAMSSGRPNRPIGVSSVIPFQIGVPRACSGGGFGVSPAYHAAKGAVRTLTKKVALHRATQGVRVNSIHPGFVATPIL